MKEPLKLDRHAGNPLQCAAEVATKRADVKNAMEQVKLKPNAMKKFTIKFYDVCARTYKRKAVQKTVEAYDQRHALQVIDRHPNLIISLKEQK